jgi:ABC-2 type transport system ATP-binding protein/lipopolysaccharide transport system ATP-binding protein
MTRIAAEGMSVEFPVVGASRSFRREILAGTVGGLLRANRSATGADVYSVTALRDLSFEFADGDRIGLVGHNGAGKTTLLRTLAGCYWPTSGSLAIDGNVTPLLSLGCGIEGDFTGLENITLFGLHLGMTRAEIEERKDEIAAFTELGSFLHMPLRTYSAGMLLRLTFAVATSSTPDILLVDEIFGAGDRTFYDKARRRMEATLESSNVFVLATHALDLVKDYCTKGCVLEKGRCVFLGSSSDAIRFYQERPAA